MIKFSLKCTNGHKFDSWFNNNETFEKLKMSHLLSCEICGSSHVEKAIMSPAISSKNNHDHDVEYVGDRFAKEVRAIYKKETALRSIYGTATKDEVVDLIDDGFPIQILDKKAAS